MKIPLRPNLWIGDSKAYSTTDELEKDGISRLIVVSETFTFAKTIKIKTPSKVQVYFMPLRSDRINAPHIKDLVCHVPKYMMQNGDTVMIQSADGLAEAAFVACRILSELEQKSIYDLFLELKRLEPSFDIGKAYF